MPPMVSQCDSNKARHSLQSTNDARITKTLPGQSLNQRLKLFFIHNKLLAAPGFDPMELAAVQASGTQPETKSVMHQYFHAVGALVGKSISAMGSGTAKHLDYPGQRLVRSGAHIQRFGG